MDIEKAITTIKYDLNKIEIFHTDRGNEFKNNILRKKQRNTEFAGIL